MEKNKDNESNVEVGVDVSDKGLSLKVKGAGTFCLLVLSICGIIFLAYIYAITDKDMLIVPIMMLLFITYQLINLLHALFKTGLYITLD